MMTEADCARWGGTCHYPQGSLVPVCDYKPGNPQFPGLEQEAKDMAEYMRRTLEGR